MNKKICHINFFYFENTPNVSRDITKHKCYSHICNVKKLSTELVPLHISETGLAGYASREVSIKACFWPLTELTLSLKEAVHFLM